MFPEQGSAEQVAELHEAPGPVVDPGLLFVRQSASPDCNSCVTRRGPCSELLLEVAGCEHVRLEAGATFTTSRVFLIAGSRVVVTVSITRT